MSMNGQNQEQTELLRNIWNELKSLGQGLGRRIDQTNERIDQTNERIDDTNRALCGRIDDTNRKLGGRIDDTNRRLGVMEEVLRDLGGQQLILTRYVKTVMEREIGELRDRLTRIEAQETT